MFVFILNPKRDIPCGSLSDTLSKRSQLFVLKPLYFPYCLFPIILLRKVQRSSYLYSGKLFNSELRNPVFISRPPV